MAFDVGASIARPQFNKEETAMYVYDQANELAKSLKESKEYLEYKKAKEEVKSIPEMKEKIDEFEKIRYETQLLTIQGEEQNEEKMNKLKELYQILMQNPKVKEYFDVEVRFNIMLADVNKIIGEAVKDVLQ